MNVMEIESLFSFPFLSRRAVPARVFSLLHVIICIFALFINFLLQYPLKYTFSAAFFALFNKNLLQYDSQAPGIFSQYPIQHEWFRPKPQKCLLVIGKVF